MERRMLGACRTSLRQLDQVPESRSHDLVVIALSFAGFGQDRHSVSCLLGTAGNQTAWEMLRTVCPLKHTSTRRMRSLHETRLWAPPLTPAEESEESLDLMFWEPAVS